MLGAEPPGGRPGHPLGSPFLARGLISRVLSPPSRQHQIHRTRVSCLISGSVVLRCPLWIVDAMDATILCS
jgi:hypothetical protein